MARKERSRSRHTTIEQEKMRKPFHSLRQQCSDMINNNEKKPGLIEYSILNISLDLTTYSMAIQTR
jgi:hypothetical protein